MAEEIQPGVFQLRTVWVESDEPIRFANMFLSQVERDTVILAFGQMVPPPLVGDDEAKKALLDSISFVPVRTMARFSMGRARLVELIDVLNQTLENFDQQAEAGGS